MCLRKEGDAWGWEQTTAGQTRPGAGCGDLAASTEKPWQEEVPVPEGGPPTLPSHPGQNLTGLMSPQALRICRASLKRGRWAVLLLENFLECHLTIITGYVYATMSGGRGKKAGYAIVYFTVRATGEVPVYINPI